MGPNFFVLNIENKSSLKSSLKGIEILTTTIFICVVISASYCIPTVVRSNSQVDSVVDVDAI